MSGKADPAFAAHEAPIVKWAEAVWEGWLPRAALSKLVDVAVIDLANRRSPWGMVKGPASAFVASAWRLGWVVHSSTAVKARKSQFQKLRRMVGARRTATVLRTGGTAALVYGQGNTGVSCSMLQSQRAAVAAASVPGGSGELELTLIVADGSSTNPITD